LFLGSRFAIGDEITLAVPAKGKGGTEILITKDAVSGRNRYFYQAPIGYVTQPRPDKRKEHFVSAEVQAGALGSARSFCLVRLCANTSMASLAPGTVRIARLCTRSCVFRELSVSLRNSCEFLHQR
jgi:hypothetical protein